MNNLLKAKATAKALCRYLRRGERLRPFIRLAGKVFAPELKEIAPCVIAPISGGLGNQIWQYAVGAGASCFSGLPVKYDLQWYSGTAKDIKGEGVRNFDLLKVFPGLPLVLAEPKEAALYRRYLWYESPYQCIFDKKMYEGSNPRYLGGFALHTDYMALLGKGFWNNLEFAAELRGKNEHFLRKMHLGGLPVAVHVRRGDYADSMHDVITPAYYRRAFSLIKDMLHPDKPVFYVFSNGMGWAREHLGALGEDIVFMENNGNDTVADDFYLMTQCCHHIIANSSLSWLAAWLCNNPDKQVIMPNAWFNKKAPYHIYRNSENSSRVKGWLKVPVN